MPSIPVCADVLPADEPVLSTTEVSRLLGFSVSKVTRMIADGDLLAVRRGRQVVVPGAFFSDGEIAKHITGLLRLLRDGGYSDDEVLLWLYTEQDDLGLLPARALHTERAREIMRRAQSLAF